MKREPTQCRFCGRRSERVALGLSCFHCGRHPDAYKIRLNAHTLVLMVIGSAAIGAAIARWV